MSEIQRYNGIEADPEGAFVYYDEYHALATRLAAAESELRKWRAGARPDDLEALRVQVEKSPTSLAAKQAYINGLCCELATSQAEATRLRDCIQTVWKMVTCSDETPYCEHRTFTNLAHYDCHLHEALEVMHKALAQPKERPQ